MMDETRHTEALPRAFGTLSELLEVVTPPETSWSSRASARLDSLTKPPGSLGRLEELAARVAVVQGTVRPSVDRKRIILMAGDHGVVAEGVSPFPQDVTSQMVANFAAGGAAINQLAASVRADLTLVDIGVAGDLSKMPGVVHANLAQGTANMAEGPAMTRELAVAAVLTGANIARDAAREGVTLLGTGEMGIGNTTAATALTCAYLGVDPAGATGSGTGLSPAGVDHKVGVIRRALEVNAALLIDPLGTLAALGGLEIAGLAGVVIGAAASKTCVVVDGFISGAAALAALRICPACADYMFPSHRSVEPGHSVVLDALGHDPVLELDMRLGEGTGAALAFGIIDAACRMISGMATFAEAGVSGAGSHE